MSILVLALFSVSSGSKVAEASTIMRFIARSCADSGLYGSDALEAAQVLVNVFTLAVVFLL